MQALILHDEKSPTANKTAVMTILYGEAICLWRFPYPLYNKLRVGGAADGGSHYRYLIRRPAARVVPKMCTWDYHPGPTRWTDELLESAGSRNTQTTEQRAV